MHRKNQSVAIALSAVLLLSVLSMLPLAPASAQVTPSITRFEISDTTCQTTGIVGATITSSYFVLMCGSTSSKELHFQLRSNGNTTQASGSLLAGSGVPIALHKVGATDCVVYYRDTTTDVLLKSCVSGTSVVTSTYTPTCASSTPYSGNYLNHPFNSAGDMYFPILCADGTAEIVRTSTMTLNGIISGFESGTPTCTAGGAMQLVTSTRGVMTCTSGTPIFLVFSYSLAGGSIVKLGSINLSGTNARFTSTIISNADGFRESYTTNTAGGNIEVYRWDLDGTIDPNSPLTTAGDFYQSINGLTGASGNQVQVQTVCAPNATGESLYCWSASGANPDNPLSFPNNQIINLSMPSGELLFPDAPIGSTGGTTFIIGKGTVNDGSGRYYVATNVVAPQPDLGIPTDSDGTIPANTPIKDELDEWGCLLGLFPTQCERVCDENGENCQLIPDNPDVKTNGMGYLAFLVIFMIFTGLLLMVLHQTNTGITEVPYYVWIILVVACAGVAAQLQLVDSTLFYASIIGGIALPASVGILSRFK